MASRSFVFYFGWHRSLALMEVCRCRYAELNTYSPEHTAAQGSHFKQQHSIERTYVHVDCGCVFSEVGYTFQIFISNEQQQQRVVKCRMPCAMCISARDQCARCARWMQKRRIETATEGMEGEKKKIGVQMFTRTQTISQLQFGASNGTWCHVKCMLE